jgi:hypothetical protein
LDLVSGSVDFSSTVTKSCIWSSQKRDDTIIIFASVSGAAVWSFMSVYLWGLEQIATTNGLRKNKIECHDLLQHDRIHTERLNTVLIFNISSTKNIYHKEANMFGGLQFITKKIHVQPNELYIITCDTMQSLLSFIKTIHKCKIPKRFKNLQT